MSDADQPGLFDELLGAPDRDLCPGVRPVLSVGPDDEPDYLANLEEHEETRVVLERRGRYHGEWSVLAERSDRDPVPLTARLHQRWHAARPIVLRGLVDPTEATEPLGERARLGEELGEACVLRALARRVATHDALPASVREYVENHAPEYADAPRDAAEIIALQR